MFKYAQLLHENHEKLANIITDELGKTHADAMGDVFRGIEVAEHACSVQSLMMGETLQNISRDVDSYSMRIPLGVCAGICPFNFPAMIPLWMFPLAITTGNTYIMKPSERVPLTSVKLMELTQEAGIPDGVVNLVHGGKETVDFMCTNPDIKAVSFVGSNRVGEYIYKTASEHGKRCQSNMGAKNHCIVMPDADKEDACAMVANAGFGAAGQRCMALSVAVFVEEKIDEQNFQSPICF